MRCRDMCLAGLLRRHIPGVTTRMLNQLIRQVIVLNNEVDDFLCSRNSNNFLSVSEIVAASQEGFAPRFPRINRVFAYPDRTLVRHTRSERKHRTLHSGVVKHARLDRCPQPVIRTGNVPKDVVGPFRVKNLITTSSAEIEFLFQRIESFARAHSDPVRQRTVEGHEHIHRIEDAITPNHGVVFIVLFFREVPPVCVLTVPRQHVDVVERIDVFEVELLGEQRRHKTALAVPDHLVNLQREIPISEDRALSLLVHLFGITIRDPSRLALGSHRVVVIVEGRQQSQAIRIFLDQFHRFNFRMKIRKCGELCRLTCGPTSKWRISATHEFIGTTTRLTFSLLQSTFY